MGDLGQMAQSRDPSVTNGKIKTTFVRIKGCKKIDRMVAKNNMKDIGMVRICKGQKHGRNNGHSENERVSSSRFANNWRDYID